METASSTEQEKTLNRRKNRKTLILLFLMFMTPVILAYAAYFGNWFAAASGAQGELIKTEALLDIEDFKLVKASGQQISGKDFETLYWWMIPFDMAQCDSDCVRMNLYTVHQTYMGLGKEASRINELAVFAKEPNIELGQFPIAISQFSALGLKAIEQTRSGKGLDLPANYIYLVDPLGNIFMRYPLVKSKQEAMARSAQLRKDILRLFKYSRLG